MILRLLAVLMIFSLNSLTLALYSNPKFSSMKLKIDDLPTQDYESLRNIIVSRYDFQVLLPLLGKVARHWKGREYE